MNAPELAEQAPRLTEQEKYEEMWKHPQYRTVAPGESLAMKFLGLPNGPKPGAEVIDFGAGTGRGALMLALIGGCKVRMLDFAANSLDEDIRKMLVTQAHALSFTQHDLTKALAEKDGTAITAEFGFCTDVMEHIPPEDVDKVLKNILSAAKNVFFQISCTDDVCGRMIGEPLHLSVHDYDWWKEKFQALECKIWHSKNEDTSCIFYVSAWSDGEDFKKAGILNVEEQIIVDNVRANCREGKRRGLMQVCPYAPNNLELIILCGGPSLDTQLETIKDLRAQGHGTATLNGAYNWAIANGIAPGCQVVCDARPFNKRFVEPVLENCKYLIASQCDPSLFTSLPADRTFLWHTTADSIKDVLNEELDVWWGIPGGCTVLLRAIPMFRMLGYSKFHLFGADSCLVDARHHAYTQTENDDALVIPVILGGRTFHCHPWMVAQAQEWIELISKLGEVFEVEVYGDGLLSWIMQHAADEDVKDELREQAAARSS